MNYYTIFNLTVKFIRDITEQFLFQIWKKYIIYRNKE